MFSSSVQHARPRRSNALTDRYDIPYVQNISICTEFSYFGSNVVGFYLNIEIAIFDWFQLLQALRFVLSNIELRVFRGMKRSPLL